MKNPQTTHIIRKYTYIHVQISPHNANVIFVLLSSRAVEINSWDIISARMQTYQKKRVPYWHESLYGKYTSFEFSDAWEKIYASYRGHTYVTFHLSKCYKHADYKLKNNDIEQSMFDLIPVLYCNIVAHSVCSSVRSTLMPFVRSKANSQSRKLSIETVSFWHKVLLYFWTNPRLRRISVTNQFISLFEIQPNNEQN